MSVLDLLSRDFVQLALLAGVVLALLAGLLGPMVVGRGMAFAVHGTAELAFAGGAGALLLFTLTNGFNVLDLGANYQGLIEGIVVVAAAAIYTLGGRRRARRPAVDTAPDAGPVTEGARA